MNDRTTSSETGKKIRSTDPNYLHERNTILRECSTGTEFRDQLIDWLYLETVGPHYDDYEKEEFLTIKPSQLYSAGILFPHLITGESLDIESVESDSDEEITNPTDLKHDGVAEHDDVDDGEIARANSYRPSAVGLSFIVPADATVLTVESFAATYLSGKPVNYPETRWIRRPIPTEKLTIDCSPVEQLTNLEPVELEPESGLTLRVLKRPAKDGTFVTVSLVNTNSCEWSDVDEHTFFQTGLRVSFDDENSRFLAYSELLEFESNDPEEEELELLYRDRRAYAVGHGCAVEWDLKADHIRRLSTTPMPVIKIPPVVPAPKDFECLKMWELSGKGAIDRESIPDLLEELPDQYEKWILQQKSMVDDLPQNLQSVALRNLDKCDAALERINDGIQLLREDDDALSAFCFANEAMVLQQVHYARAGRYCDDSWVDFPPIPDGLGPYQGKWRVFQLAFMLMNLRSSYRGFHSPEREVVDLIWFPTGGGKTEAYLGLSAFTIFIRRLKNRADNGCAILMRYTLRLLTVQQFQRACSLVAACEFMRQRMGMNELLGDSPISIGLWVGQSSTPNNRSEAKKVVSGLLRRDSTTKNKFQLLKCPWCGTKLDGHPRDFDKSPLGYKTVRSHVRFSCPESRCDFHGSNYLPVKVVDEDIYEEPPTLIIGTVDKFAMLAWNQEAGSIFGRAPQTPPDLVIQDELHLISGPVGTLVGLYEAVISELCKDDEGLRPKIVGSTATIRRAEEQCRQLYDSPVSQFPPAGISASDSFYAVEDNSASQPGRVYIGAMPTGASSFITGIVRIFSALLEGADVIPASSAKVRDGYWTLIQYFNSLRELGRAATLLQQDIPEWMFLRSRAKGKNSRGVYYVDELTSRKDAEEIPKTLDRLTVELSDDDHAGRPFDSVLATNMISVGVDVPRLGLMAIVGQPKTTSEYIQASSRVGRGNNAPGLVVACYNPSKARDRSHFESFTQYHNAIYRYVEPTSVTPFAIPAQEKALHALVVICARHICRIQNPSDFDSSDSRFTNFVDQLIERCKRLDPDHVDELTERLDSLVDFWNPDHYSNWGSITVFDRDDQPLLAPPNTPVESHNNLSWPTPTSLRGVDVECVAQVVTNYNILNEEVDL